MVRCEIMFDGCAKEKIKLVEALRKLHDDFDNVDEECYMSTHLEQHDENIKTSYYEDLPRKPRTVPR